MINQASINLGAFFIGVRTMKPYKVTPEQEKKNLERLRNEKFSERESRELRGETRDIYRRRKGGAYINK